MESPNIRLQRSRFMSVVCMNSDERAYQVPYSTEAHACISPIGSTLISTISANPILIAQNANVSGPFFHAFPGRSARRQNSISPNPSVPYTPNSAVCAWTAVGFLANSSQQTVTTLVEHWDGMQWSVIPSPNQSVTAGSFNTLRSVTGTSGSNLYAAGFFANAQTGGQQQTLVEHFDGQNWSIIASPTKGIAQQLQGIFALPDTSNLWTVGAFSFEQTDPETGFLIVPRRSSCSLRLRDAPEGSIIRP